ncbi:MAG: hypothetical protein IKI83_07100 [Prevotella sp.]|nr:hypothetical protein [Prevotella sp.]
MIRNGWEERMVGGKPAIGRRYASSCTFYPYHPSLHPLYPYHLSPLSALH